MPASTVTQKGSNSITCVVVTTLNYFINFIDNKSNNNNCYHRNVLYKFKLGSGGGGVMA